MFYVTARLTGGIGNRLFQIGAMLGYAEKYGHTAVFVKSQMSENPHDPVDICSLFKTIPLIDDIAGLTWEQYYLPAADDFSFVNVPRLGNVVLHGCYQSELYFPSSGVTWDVTDVVARPNTVFLHVRRGDYLHPACAHHKVDLMTYYRNALSLYGRECYVYVFSDDILWCKQNLPAELAGVVAADKWIWDSGGGGVVESILRMASCEAGGICANSSFSWWGAYFGFRRHGQKAIYCFPSCWGYPPLPPAKDIWPAWGVKIPTE